MILELKSVCRLQRELRILQAEQLKISRQLLGKITHQSVDIETLRDKSERINHQIDQIQSQIKNTRSL